MKPKSFCVRTKKIDRQCSVRALDIKELDSRDDTRGTNIQGPTKFVHPYEVTTVSYTNNLVE